MTGQPHRLFVEEHEAAYTAIFRSRGEQRMDAMLESLAGWEDPPASVERTPALETAVQGWFFFIEGAVLRWLERRDLERDQLRELLASALIGSLAAAESLKGPAGQR